jgi:predicted Rossmann-fold nucleotide-binding protein
MFIEYPQALALLPGGFGMMDELFEELTLAETGRRHGCGENPGRRQDQCE